MIKVNVLKPTAVDVQTPAERDAGQVDVGIQKDIGVNIKPTVGVSITNNICSLLIAFITMSFYVKI